MHRPRVAHVFFLLVLLGPALASQVDGEWTTFKRDLGRTAFLPGEEGLDSPSVIWSYETGDYVYSSPILHDGRLYVGSGDNSFYCLDGETGELYWSFPTGDVIQGTATIQEDQLYVPSYDGNLYCLDPGTGGEIWSFPTAGTIFSSPAVDSGLVVFGASDLQLYCINAADGSQEWSFLTTDSVWASPAIEDGRIYVGSGSLFYCLELDTGSLVWSTVLGEDIIASAAVQYQEVYVATTGNNLPGFVYHLDARTGQVLWSFQEPDGGGFFSSPAISERRVVIGSDSRKVYGLERDSGAFLWDTGTGGVISSSPAIAGEKVYVGSGDGAIYCLGLETGLEEWSVMTGDVVYSSPCVQDGRLWVGSWDTRVYCIGQGTDQPAITVELVEPSQENMSADEGFTIRFESSSSDVNDTLALYYSSELNESDTQLITQAPASELNDTYLWDTSDVVEGSYWIMVELNSGDITVKNWSEGTVLVSHPDEKDDDSDDSFLPGFGLMELVILIGIVLLLRRE